MATQVKIRRGTTAQMAAFTGVEGEINLNTTTHRIHSQDGATANGFPHALLDDLRDSSLAANVAAAATSISVLNLPHGVIANVGYIIIDAFTTEAEVRRVSSVSGGTTLNLDLALSFAHSLNDVVLFVQADYVSTFWFGAKGTDSGSIDEEPALQQAIVQANRYGLWVDGSNRTYRIRRSLILMESSKWRTMGIRVDSTFAPLDTNNAAIMNSSGVVLSFTSDGTTDVFTTPSAHGNAAGEPVVFKTSSAGSLPSGITAGKVYYVLSSGLTATAFKVTDTRGSTTPVDVGTGVGTVYNKVLTLGRVYANDVVVYCTDKSLNGWALNLQQPTIMDKVRADSSLLAGFVLSGQHARITGMQTNHCTIGLACEDMKYLYCFEHNMEGDTTGGANPCITPVLFRKHANLQVFPGQSVTGEGLTSSCFIGCHYELVDANAVVFDIEGLCQNVKWESLDVKMTLNTQKVWYIHTGDAGKSSGVIENCFVSSAAPGYPVLLDDSDRGHNYLAWGANNGDPFMQIVQRISFGVLPTSLNFPDRYPNLYLRPGGGFIGFGSQRPEVESFIIQPDSAQSGDNVIVRDTSGASRFTIDKDGTFITKRVAAPADGDLANSEMSITHDDTAGAQAAVFKGKDSAGVAASFSLPFSGLSGGVPRVDVLIQGYGAFNTDWNSFPSADTIFLGTARYGVRFDLTTGFTQCRLVVFLSSSPSGSAPKLYAAYSTISSLGSFTAIDNSTGSEIDISSGGGGVKTSAWVNIDAGALGDVYLVVIGKGGDDASTASFGRVSMQFK